MLNLKKYWIFKPQYLISRQRNRILCKVNSATEGSHGIKILKIFGGKISYSDIKVYNGKDE